MYLLVVSILVARFPMITADSQTGEKEKLPSVQKVRISIIGAESEIFGGCSESVILSKGFCRNTFFAEGKVSRHQDNGDR